MINNSNNIINVCSKKDMILNYNTNDCSYTLNFSVINKIYDYNQLLSFKIYDLLEKLNPDIIEKIEIIKIISDDEINVLFILKQLGKEIGLSKKYMYIKTIKEVTNNFITLKSINIEDNSDINHLKYIKNATKIECKYANLFIYLENNNNDLLNISYNFLININENLPLSMKHLIGLMMKKIFFNLKLFVEKTNN